MLIWCQETCLIIINVAYFCGNCDAFLKERFKIESLKEQH